MLVASAFRLAYAQSQSATGGRDQATPTGYSVPASSVSSHASSQPLTPIPISGSPALTFQDMLRGPQRDASFVAPVGPSWSPAHSSVMGGAPPGTSGGDELSARLLQISTPNVDQMVVERRHRRNAEQSMLGLEDTNSSNISGGSPVVNSSPPSARVSTELCYIHCLVSVGWISCLAYSGRFVDWPKTSKSARFLLRKKAVFVQWGRAFQTNPE